MIAGRAVEGGRNDLALHRALHIGDFLRAFIHEHDHQVHFGIVGQLPGQAILRPVLMFYKVTARTKIQHDGHFSVFGEENRLQRDTIAFHIQFCHQFPCLFLGSEGVHTVDSTL